MPLRVILAVAGALIGFGTGYLLYEWLNPALEARTDWLRELQGLLFNLVLVCALAGIALGWWLGRRLERRR